ncbi:MAG: hypothetical protein EPN51_25280 [Mycobacterium sp.]|nr:MAG: hypothetical protein EPN51_25280 [Mycobacterium sp.]
MRGMGVAVRRVRAMIALLVLGAAAGLAPAGADPAAGLPPMTSSGSGPIIGGGSAAAQGIAQQLFSFGNPNVVQEVDGSDAAQFIAAAAGATGQQLAAPFALLRRALTCQTDNSGSGAGFGARAYRRNDGQWGGAMLAAAKSATPNLDSLVACVKTNWRRAAAGGETAMCNNGWTTPTSYESRRGETYYILLAGTAADFCGDLNAKYKGDASGWPF